MTLQNKQKIEINLFCLLIHQTTTNILLLYSNNTKLNPLDTMEKRINEQTRQYISTFKDDIRNKIVELGIKDTEHVNEL